MRRPSRKTILGTAGAAALVAVVAVGIVLAGTGTGTGSTDAGGARETSRLAGAAAEPRPGDGAPAPELEGTDPITGERVSLADFRGKPVVINVWASWCPGCNDEAVDLREFAAAHPEAEVLGLDFQDSQAGAREFYDRWEWTHPSIFDVSGAKSAELGLVGLPMTFFLDSEHRVAAVVAGATDRAGFEQGLELATT